MADKVTTYNQVKFVATFADGDTRTFTIDNPKGTDAELGTAIAGLDSLASGVIVGDKYGSSFVRFADARRISGTRTELDLTQ